MSYAITSPCCQNEQIYKPRGDKFPKNPHTDCKKCGKDFNFEITKTEGPESEPKGKSRSSQTLKNTGSGVKSPSPLTFTKVDDDSIEFAILELLNQGLINPQLIGKMIEFYYKIRGKDDKITDDIDMEALKALGSTLESSE